MKKLSSLPVWGRKRRRLEALAAIASFSVPKKSACCMRCGCVAYEDTSRPLAVTGNLVNASMTAMSNVLLCGRCYLLLVELLFPEKVGDPRWEKYKTDKLLEWG